MSQELLLKRLRYRSLHRGCKETDLLFGKFSESQLAALGPSEIAAYERLLEENDADIWGWMTGKTPPAAEYAPLIAMLKSCVLS